ncbi:16S rRNA m(4)C1402 methyltransferase [Mariprofundus micogutta]|uniref:16S rRNA m(4)C1402 methyltransferase n=1 Tax=Mariprofundus micogutta TaxID=1921010 RepID=A0A1L8CKL5_9PROT|nr:class I SAM-dependent methyltransferase [Mariprofundus micogutta]GAV19454.1 16S rRNA m(4)C1402 methyltransferase [Mariprofundus micogutta]
MSRISLTEKVHQSLLPRFRSGSIAIDATAGNGFDTLFLASRTSESGSVFAFDIQQQAIETTRKRLDEAGLLDRTMLICDGHENMAEHIPAPLHGNVDMVLFNLGYLPKADKSVITHTSTTLQALNCALRLLSDAGYISILAYPGHPGGREETEAVKLWAKSLPETSFNICIHKPEHSGSSSPEWIEITSVTG